MRPKAQLGPVSVEKTEDGEWCVVHREHGQELVAKSMDLDHARERLAEFVALLRHLADDVIRDFNGRQFEPEIAVNFLKASIRNHLRAHYPMISLRQIAKQLKETATIQDRMVYVNLEPLIKRIHVLCKQPWPVK